jgi:hypothetical protein
MEYPEIKVIENGRDRGFKRRNKPKMPRKIYEGKPKEVEELNKQELKNNAAVRFISHNVNMERGRQRPLELCLWHCAGVMCQIAWGSLSPRSPETHAKSSVADLNPVGYP